MVNKKAEPLLNLPYFNFNLWQLGYYFPIFRFCKGWKGLCIDSQSCLNASSRLGLSLMFPIPFAVYLTRDMYLAIVIPPFLDLYL